MQTGHIWTTIKTSWQICEFVKKWLEWAKVQKKGLQKFHTTLLLNSQKLIRKKKLQPFGIFWPTVIRNFLHVYTQRLQSLTADMLHMARMKTE